MEGRSRDLEALIRSYALRQHGNVTRRQLLVAGVGPGVIDRRTRIGAFRAMFRGVYLVTHGPPPPLARECAAVLACAPRAFIDGRTAAGVIGLCPRWRGHIDITVVGRQIRGQRGLAVRTIDSIDPAELRRHQGIPIASPSLTLLRFAADASKYELGHALDNARVRKLVTEEDLRATLAAHPKRKGARALRRLLASERARFTIESHAEELCLRLMVEHGLEPDASQAQIGPYRVDFLYRAERLVVEVDGFRWHGAPTSFVRDRRRTAALLALGYVVFPVTWWDLTGQPDATFHRLRATLAARGRELGLSTPGS